MNCEETKNKKSGHRLWRLLVYLTWVRLQTRYMHWGGRHWQTANLSFPSKLAKVAIFHDVWSLPSPIFPVSRLGLSSETIFAMTIITRVLLRTTTSGVYYSRFVWICQSYELTIYDRIPFLHIWYPYSIHCWKVGYTGKYPPRGPKGPRDSQIFAPLDQTELYQGFSRVPQLTCIWM